MATTVRELLVKLGVKADTGAVKSFDSSLARAKSGMASSAKVAAGLALAVAGATVRYLAPIRFDEEVELIPRVSHMGTTSLLTSIRIEAERGTAAEGEIRHVFVAYGTSEKAPIPDDVRGLLAPYEA